MAGNRNAAENYAFRVILIRLIAVLIVVIILIVIGRAWFKSAFSCVRMFDSMEYVDEDERQRLVPWDTPVPTPPGLTDEAYDRVFPDLVEPTVSP